MGSPVQLACAIKWCASMATITGVILNGPSGNASREGLGGD